MRTVKSLLFNQSAIFDMLSSDKPHEHCLSLRKKQKTVKQKSKKEGKKVQSSTEGIMSMILRMMFTHT